MSSLLVGRLLIGPPLQWFEQMGDPVQGLGGAVVSAPRTPPNYQPTIGTLAADGASDLLADRLRIRRQLRSLLNNTPLKLGGFIYVVYSDDLEQDGWFVPDQASLQDYTAASGLATGFWQIASGSWYLAGRMRTHREARSAWLKDLRTGLYARDQLGWIVSTDFSGLAALPLTILPNGATSASDSVTGAVVSGAPLPAGRDTGIATVVEGLTDGTVLAYERPESALNLSDVVARDRRGSVVANYIMDPSFEYDTVSGAAVGVTVTNSPPTVTAVVSNSWGATGTKSLAISCTATAVSQSSGVRVAIPNAPTLVTGQPWSASCVVNVTTAPTAGITLQLSWVNSGGTQVAATLSTVASGTGIQTLTVSSTVPATATVVRLQIFGKCNNIGDAYAFNVDDITATPTLLPAVYVDGDTTGYDWLSNSGNSVTIVVEEAYGPDHAWNWLTAGQPIDAPTLDNGLVRVRYDGVTGDDGFRIDVWTTAAGYVEQGKVTFERVGDSTGFCNTWVSAGMVEWTPERATIEVVLANSADANSRERVFVTVQRGQVGATFECYPAPKAAGTSADVKIFYTMNGPDSNDSVMFEPATSTPASGHDSIWSSASSNWTSASGTFSASTANFLSILRCQGGASTVGPYQVCLAVLQKSTTFAGVSDASAYGGTAQNAVAVSGAGGMGYLQARVSYVATQSDMVHGTGSFTSTQASQYRVFGLVTTTWTDFGEYTGTTVTTGSSTRVEAHLTQDRTRTGALWNGCRDFGQSSLIQSRQNGAIVAR